MDRFGDNLIFRRIMGVLDPFRETQDTWSLANIFELIEETAEPDVPDTELGFFEVLTRWNNISADIQVHWGLTEEQAELVQHMTRRAAEWEWHHRNEGHQLAQREQARFPNVLQVDRQAVVAFYMPGLADPMQRSDDINADVQSTCDIGLDECTNEVVSLSCGHVWCTVCIKGRFEAAAQSVINYPPKCCDPFNIDEYKHLFDEDKEFLALYKSKEEQYKTPVDRFVWCANVRCTDRFLKFTDGDSKSDGYMECSGCLSKTCINCKSEIPEVVLRHTCLPEDTDTTQPDLGYSRQNRVKLCPNPDCGTAYFLAEACNHISCNVCRHEWCFVCLQPYWLVLEHHPCPMYGDPTYDKDGYMREHPRLHRDTGFDRDGFNLIGLNAQGFNRTGGTEPTPPYNGVANQRPIPAAAAIQEGAEVDGMIGWMEQMQMGEEEMMNWILEEELEMQRIQGMLVRVRAMRVRRAMERMGQAAARDGEPAERTHAQDHM